MNIREHFGRQVARLRTARGMTQADLAAELSETLGETVAPLTVTRIETAKRPTILEEVIALSTVFGVDPAILMATGPVAMARKNLHWHSAQTQRRFKRLHAEAGLELESLKALAALIPPVETLDAYVRTGSTSGVREALASLTDADKVPEFAEATTLQDLAIELVATLREDELARFAKESKGGISLNESVALIGGIIEERGDAET